MALPSKNLHQHYAGKTVLVTGHTGGCANGYSCSALAS